jgi:hypothetical protein
MFTEEFNAADTDGNGEIDIDELTAAFEAEDAEALIKIASRQDGADEGSSGDSTEGNSGARNGTQGGARKGNGTRGGRKGNKTNDTAALAKVRSSMKKVTK